MKLEDLSIAIRPRRPLEAADLGAQVIRVYSGPVYRVWAAIFIPLLVSLLLIDHFFDYAITAWVLWWLKPLYDYALLWLLSRAVFGEIPPIRDLPRAIPGFFQHGLFSALTWRRFSLLRSFTLPIWLLEAQKGYQRSQRVQLLGESYTSHARSVMQVLALCELSLTLGGIFLVLMLIPDQTPINRHIRSLLAAENHALSPAWNYVMTISYAVAISIIEPIYVAAGFMLYLNRRTDLEAWDVEISLRRLANRLRGASGS